MVEVLKRLLDREKYSIIEGKGYIRIHDYIPDTNMEDQEVFIQVEFTDNIYAGVHLINAMNKIPEGIHG